MDVEPCRPEGGVCIPLMPRAIRPPHLDAGTNGKNAKKVKEHAELAHSRLLSAVLYRKMEVLPDFCFTTKG